MSLPIEYNDLLNVLHRHEPDVFKKTKTFISQNKNIDNPKEYYKKILHFAFMFGHFDSVTLLLKAGADKSSLGFSQIHEAIVWGTLQDVKKYLNSNNIEMKDSEGCTPFLLAVKVGNIKKVKLLAQHEADSSSSSRMYHSALMYAVRNDDVVLLQYLLALGLDINGHKSDFRFNEKNGCLKTPSKYGILVRNKGLFTDGCKKVIKVVQNANKRVL